MEISHQILLYFRIRSVIINLGGPRACPLSVFCLTVSDSVFVGLRPNHKQRINCANHFFVSFFFFPLFDFTLTHFEYYAQSSMHSTHRQFHLVCCSRCRSLFLIILPPPLFSYTQVVHFAYFILYYYYIVIIHFFFSPSS